jgi:hypothetical protein
MSKQSFGARLYEISKRRHAVAIGLLAALLASVFTLYRPSLLPPGLHARALHIGTASTELLIAKPSLIVGGSSYEYESMVNRAVLVGNVMVTPPVMNYVGRVLGVPPGRIQATAPMTANVPRALIDPGSGGSATDIVASPDHYKLEIQADPSVPVLHVYAQGPSTSKAIHLAHAAVQGVVGYLRQMQAAGKIPPAQQVDVQQLGAPRGGIANPGGPTQMAILVFLGVFGVSLWLITIVTKIRRGWATARLAQQLQL